jgi:hypothetical protein
MWRTLTSSSPLMFCAAFTLTLGVAVGLATTNLGTLSRYRMPLVPFFVAMVLVWVAPDLRDPRIDQSGSGTQSRNPRAPHNADPVPSPNGPRHRER